MLNLLLAIGFLALSVACPLHAEEPALRDMRLTYATGHVTLKTADHPKQAVMLDQETPLSELDVIETGPLSRAEITIDRETVLHLHSDSRFIIKKLFLKNTQLELTRGRVLAKIKPALQPDQGMILKMPTAVVAIRGTELAAETGKGESHVCVFDEGEVVVAGVWGHEHVIVRSHQETMVTLSNVPRAPHAFAHFKNFTKQMPILRNRVAFWGKNWRPLSSEKKQRIRQHLYDPGRKPSTQFHQRIVSPPHKTKILKKKVGSPKKQNVVKVKKGKPGPTKKPTRATKHMRKASI